MAKGKGRQPSGERSYNPSSRENVKNADILTAAKSLGGPADYSKGYPDVMRVHINEGGKYSDRGDKN